MIKGLKPTFATLGYIKIGGTIQKEIRGKTHHVPTKYDHFVVTTTERHEDGYIPDETLMARLREYEQRDDGNIHKIVVFLPFDEPERNLASWLCHYDSHGCRCRGDGERAKYFDPTTQRHQEIECPCDMLRGRLDHSPTVDRRPKHPHLQPNYQRGIVCKPRGNLSVMIGAARTLGGVHLFTTTSYNTIKNLYMAMSQIKRMTGGVLADCVPLELSISSRRVKPADSQHRQTIYTVNLTYSDDPLSFLKRVAEQFALRAQMQRQIVAPTIGRLPPPLEPIEPGDEPPQEQIDVAQEFYATDMPEDYIDVESSDTPPPSDSDEPVCSEPLRDDGPPPEASAAVPINARKNPLLYVDFRMEPSHGEPLDEMASLDHRKKLFDAAQAMKISNEQMLECCAAVWQTTKTKDLKVWQINSMLEGMSQLKSERRALQSR